MSGKDRYTMNAWLFRLLLLVMFSVFLQAPPCSMAPQATPPPAELSGSGYIFYLMIQLPLIVTLHCTVCGYVTLLLLCILFFSLFSLLQLLLSLLLLFPAL